MRPWIGIDLDSCLAHGEGRDGDPIGDPYPDILALVQQWLGEGREVRIFTARAGSYEGRFAVMAWLARQGLPPLRVTNQKDYECALFLDDRARQVKDGKVLGDIALKPPCHHA